MQTFHIETPNARLYLELSTKGEYEIQLSEYFTPFNNDCNCFDVCMEEENTKGFLKIIDYYRKESVIRIYTKEEDHYRPFIIEQNKYKNIYETFFYKMLKNSENFVKDDDLDSNFLEQFEIEEINRNHYQGFYTSYTLIPRSTRITNTDTGTFQMEIKTEGNDSIITTSVENIRIYKDFYYESPYNTILNIPNRNSVTKTQIKEYYLRFTEDCIVHFSENLAIIEVILKENDVRIINKKEEPKTAFEKEIVDFVNHYQKKEEQIRSRKNQE